MRASLPQAAAAKDSAACIVHKPSRAQFCSGGGRGGSSGGSSAAVRPSTAGADCPAFLLCPITNEVMADPVVAADGYTHAPCPSPPAPRALLPCPSPIRACKSGSGGGGGGGGRGLTCYAYGSAACTLRARRGTHGHISSGRCFRDGGGGGDTLQALPRLASPRGARTRVPEGWFGWERELCDVTTGSLRRYERAAIVKWLRARNWRAPNQNRRTRGGGRGVAHPPAIHGASNELWQVLCIKARACNRGLPPPVLATLPDSGICQLRQLVL